MKQVVNEKFGPKFGLKSPFSSFKAAESNAVGVAPKATILDELVLKFFIKRNYCLHLESPANLPGKL